jgi:actin-related protein
MEISDEKQFYSNIKEIKKLKIEIERVKEERNKEAGELFKKLLKTQKKYKDIIFKMENDRRGMIKSIVKNWDKFVKGRQFEFENEMVTKVPRYDFKVSNKLEVAKLLILMKRDEALEFIKPKIRELIRIGSIPEEYIKKIDQSFIRFTRVK